MQEGCISLMQMDPGLDTGPVFAARALSIGAEETAGELAARLAELAALVVREDVPRAVRGDLVATPQEDDAATYAPPIEREDARKDGLGVEKERETAAPCRRVAE